MIALAAVVLGDDENAGSRGERRKKRKKMSTVTHAAFAFIAHMLASCPTVLTLSRRRELIRFQETFKLLFESMSVCQSTTEICFRGCHDILFMVPRG